MNERQVFTEALDIENPVERAVYLDKACAGQPELRARVEALLAAHDKASQFLERPATEKFPTADNLGDMTQAFDTRTMPPVGEGAQEGSDADEGLQTVLRLLEPSSQPGSLGRLGHYEILQVLGQGGFGIVFKAFDEKLHRPVAIKMISPQMAATSPPRKRFLREARSAAAMHHENVVSVHSVEEQPLPYLVMEYVNGQTLQQKLDGIGPLDLFEVLHLGRQIAAGLAAAHSHGLIHRDIKPANILIEKGADQRVKITDFGLARAADDASMTQTGFVAGTPMYMAPEQATGAVLDHRADLFSLGSVLYVMTAGRPPFRASSTLAVLRRVVEDTPRPIPEIIPETPDWLCAIISKLHAKQPEDRFETAKEVADLLARCHAELQLHGKVEAALPADLREAMEACRAGREATALLPVAEPAAATELSGARAVTKQPSRSRRRPLVAAAILLGLLVGGFALAEATGVTRFTALADRTPEQAEPSAGEDSQSDSAISAAQVEDAQVAESDERLAAQEQTSAEQATTTEAQDTASAVEVALAEAELDPALALTAVNLPSLPEWQLPEGAPAPANVPFSPEQAKTHQEAWAAYLKRPVVEEHELGMKFALIPPGDFVSTAPADDQPLESKALARRKSRIMAPFQLAATEVTLGQYRQFVEETGHRGHFTGGIHYLRGDSSLVQGEAPWLKTTSDEHDPQQAVTHVNWDDAVAFCHWLSQKSGRTYRLPTEEEWEYAYCAGTIGFLGGCKSPQALPQFGWFREECVDGDPAKIVTPRAVGTKKANAFGLYDVAGNVWEWCHYGGRLRASLKNPQIGAFEPKRVLHGKSYTDPVETTERNPFDSGERRPNVGFRMLCELPESASFEPDLPPLTNESDSLKKRLPEWTAPADAPPLAIVPFSPAKAKQHQQRWADYLKKPVEEANSLGMPMVLIPPGEFPFFETAAHQHRVTSDTDHTPVRIARPMYLSATEVTHAQFEAFVAATGYVTEVEKAEGKVFQPAIRDGGYSMTGWQEEPGLSWRKPGAWTPRADDPVVAISPGDAQAFCDWLSKQEGVRYRLPNEAEWAFACLAGADNDQGLPLGYSAVSDYVWMGREGLPIDKSPLMPAKSLSPNPFGLFHMHGNTHELCRRLEDTLDGSTMMARYHGTGWNSSLEPGRSYPFFRDQEHQLDRASINLGFRVVREIDDLTGLPLASAAVQLPLLRETELGPAAIVRYPAKLPGLRTWTLTTRQPSSNWIETIAISPDGKQRATASVGELIIRIWNDKFELKRVLVGHTENVVALAFSPDGRYLASREQYAAESGGTAVHVWEIETGQKKCSVSLEGRQLNWSPDSRKLALSEDGMYEWRTLQPGVLEVETGKLHRLSGKMNGNGSMRLAWSPSGDRIAVLVNAGLGGKLTQLLRLYDGQTYELLKERPLEHLGGYSSPYWSPEGDRIAFADAGFVKIWNVATDEVKDAAPYEHWPQPLWLPDGKRLVIRDANGIRRWNLETKEVEQSLPPEDYECSLLADGQLAIFRSEWLKILNVESWKVVHEMRRDPSLSVHESNAAVSPDGRQVVVSGGDQLTFWESESGKFLRRIPNVPTAKHLGWSPGGDQVLVRSGSTVELVAIGGSKRRQLKHAADVWSFAWSPNGQEVATACSDGTLSVWETSTGKARVIETAKEPLMGVAWSPDGERLATVTEKKLLCWNVATGQEIGQEVELGRSLYIHGGGYASSPELVAWHPDGETVFVAGSRIEWRTGKTVGGYQPEIFLELSPDGKRLAVTGNSTSFVSAEGGRTEETRHFELANWLPDSRRLLGRRCESYKQVVAYDADNNEPLGTLIPRLGREQFVCIGPDGHYRGSRRVDEHLVYVAVHDDGSQTTHTPDEFEKQFGWKNDPEKASFLALDPQEQEPAVEEPKPPEPTGEPLDKGLVWPRTVSADVELPADELSREPGGHVSPLALVPQPSAIEGLESWSVETYAHLGPISSIAVHPTGPIVATGGDYDGSIRLCDLECNVHQVLLGHDRSRASGAIMALAWSPGGRWLASCDSDRTLRIWDAPAGKLQQSTALDFIPSSLSWSNDGTKIALTGEANGWTMLDLVTRAAYSRPDTARNMLAWHGDNGLIATVGDDGVIRHWDLETLGLDHEVRLADIEHPVHRAVRLHDGKSLAAIFGSEGKRLGMWNLATGELLQSTSSQAGFGNVLACSDSGALVTANQRLQVIDAAGLSLQWLAPVPGQVPTAAACGHGRVFYSAGSQLHGATVKEGIAIPLKDNLGVLTRENNWLEVDPQGAALWTRSGPFTRRWSLPGGEGAGADLETSGYFRASPDGKRLAGWLDGNGIRIRDAITGAVQQTITGLESQGEVAWSPDGRYLASNDGGEVQVRNHETGKIVKRFGPLSDNVQHLGWSPNGRTLAAGSVDGQLALFGGKDSKPLWTQTEVAHKGFSGSLFDWSPDGNELAVWKPDGSITRLNAETGASRYPDLPPRPTVLEAQLHYSPSGKYLAVSQAESTLVVELENGQETEVLPYPTVLRWMPKEDTLLMTQWLGSPEVQVYDVARKQPGGRLLPRFADGNYASIGANGHYAGSSEIEKHLLYVARHADGRQETFTPAGFSKRFGWKNDPEQVSLLPASEARE